MEIDFDRVAGFEWDAGNASKSAAKHGVEPAEAEQLFFNDPLLIVVDAAHSQNEPRFLALGRTNARRLLFAVFTLRMRETLIRVISVRDMNARERRRYGEEA